jgi:hypothetical protein
MFSCAPLAAVRTSFAVPCKGAFGTCAVITLDVDDDGVIPFAQIVYGLNHAANFVVGFCQVSGIHTPSIVLPAIV